ncbi:MAG TPA: flavin reductase family protein [bacterium]|nr:flavin reductase family protein [bacterium]
MHKVEFEPAFFYRFLNCGPAVLAVAQHGGPPNIITLAWVAPVSHDPPLVMLSVSPRRYSHNLIRDGREVTVNVPPWSLLEEVAFCGRVSGRDVDKFAETALTPVPSERVKPPGIEQCLATLECVWEKSVGAGDHTAFIMRVVHVVADEEAAMNRFGPGPGEPTTIHHLTGNFYAPLGGPASEAGKPE